jgi:hypothetical protein
LHRMKLDEKGILHPPYNEPCLEVRVSTQALERRTCARRLLAAAIPQTLALTMMGIASDSIFRRYAIADAAIQLAAQRKVAELTQTGIVQP